MTEASRGMFMPDQQRITRQIDDLLKVGRDPVRDLWSMWVREADDNADAFVAVMIGELCATRALAKLRSAEAGK